MSDRAMSQRAGGHGMFLAIAPLIFAVSWSTGNIFAKLGMPYIEPLTFLALRFSFATLLLVGLSWIARAPWPSSFGEAGHIVVAGFLFHGGYLWSVFIAVDEGVSTGTLALIAGCSRCSRRCWSAGRWASASVSANGPGWFWASSASAWWSGAR